MFLFINSPIAYLSVLKLDAAIIWRFFVNRANFVIAIITSFYLIICKSIFNKLLIVLVRKPLILVGNQTLLLISEYNAYMCNTVPEATHRCSFCPTGADIGNNVAILFYPMQHIGISMLNKDWGNTLPPFLSVGQFVILTEQMFYTQLCPNWF